MRTLLTILFLLPIICFSQPKLFVRDGFEASNWLNHWDAAELNSLSKAERSDSTTQTGRYSLRFEINKSGTSNVRSEIRTKVFPTMYMDLWTEFSLYIPNDFARDSVDETFMQYHEYPDFNLGEDYRSPPISLRIRKDSFICVILSAASAVNTNLTLDSNRTFNLGKVQKGAWMTWRIYTKFRYTNTGITKVWRNDTLVLDKTNYANYYNDQKGPYLKFGIYKPDWSSGNPSSVLTKRILFLDNITVGDKPIISKKIFQPWAD
ncbi:MAG: polysaccharide lyase [Agriterribacter sp.]